MANAVVLSASILLGPVGASDCGFPSAVTNFQFTTTPPQKNSGASMSGAKAVNSAGAFTTLDGVGANQAVTQGNFLYARSMSPMKLRITCTDPEGGADILSIIPFQGSIILEFQSTGWLKLLEAKGVGTVEYMISGNQ